VSKGFTVTPGPTSRSGDKSLISFGDLFDGIGLAKQDAVETEVLVTVPRRTSSLTIAIAGQQT
jgi:hypothetical protein